MQPRTIALAATVVIGLGVGLWLWPRAQPATQGPRGADSSSRAAASRPGAPAGSPSPHAVAKPTPITKTVVDRALRDELRRRILEAQREAAESPTHAVVPTHASASAEPSAERPELVPAPVGANGETMDPAYIKSVVRSEFIPMAGKCYEELLSRGASRGKMTMKFTIVADPDLGAIVDDVTVVAEEGMADEAMTTCARESMYALSFQPPASGGSVSVSYPLLFSPEDEPGRE